MPEVTLRPCTMSDFATVMQLECRSFPLDAYTDEMLKERLLSYPEGFLVATIGLRIVGYIAVWVVHGKARIDTMAVDPEFRRQGIGSLMLSAALEHFRAKGFREVELEVRPTNEEAIHLYEHFGFRQTGIKRQYYAADGSDAVVMTLQLSE